MARTRSGRSRTRNPTMQNVAWMCRSRSRASSFGVFTGSGPSSKVSATAWLFVVRNEPTGPSPSWKVGLGDGDADGDGLGEGAAATGITDTAGSGGPARLAAAPSRTIVPSSSRTTRASRSKVPRRRTPTRRPSPAPRLHATPTPSSGSRRRKTRPAPEVPRRAFAYRRYMTSNQNAWSGTVTKKSRGLFDGSNLYRRVRVGLEDGTRIDVKVDRDLWRELEVGDRLVQDRGGGARRP